jgi:hypothetical protein
MGSISPAGSYYGAEERLSQSCFGMFHTLHSNTRYNQAARDYAHTLVYVFADRFVEHAREAAKYALQK